MTDNELSLRSAITKLVGIDLSHFAPTDTFSPDPVVVTRRRLMEQRELARVLHKAIAQIVRNYFDDARISEIISLPRDVVELLEQCPVEYDVGTFRPDILHAANGKMRVREINARFPTNGYFVSHALNIVAGQLPHLASKGVAGLSSLERIPLAFLELFAPDLPIGVVRGRERGGDVHLFCDAMAAAGREVRRVAPSELRIDNSLLCDASGPIEQLVLELHQDEIMALSPDVRSAMARSLCLNDLRTIFIAHDKRILSVLATRAIMTSYLEPHEVGFLAEHLPGDAAHNDHVFVGSLLCFNDEFFGPGIYRASNHDVVSVATSGSVLMPVMRTDDAALKESAQSEVVSIDLDAASSAALRWGLLDAPSPYGDRVDTAVAYACKRVVDVLSIAQMEQVERFHRPDAPGVLLLSNLPVDPRLPATPSDGGEPLDKFTFVSESILLGIAQILGRPYGFRALKDGALISTIAPVQTREGAQSNQTCDSEFFVHTEVAFSDLRPPMLALFCLRADHEAAAATTFVTGKVALSLLTDDVRSVLREPLFVIGAPESWKGAHRRGDSSAATPLLSGPDDSPELRLNLETTCGTDARSNDALAKLRAALEEPSVLRKVYLRPGDLIVFNNHKVVRGRTAFTPRYDGTDRWLQRAYITSSFWHGRTFGNDTPRIFERS